MFLKTKADSSLHNLKSKTMDSTLTPDFQVCEYIITGVSVFWSFSARLLANWNKSQNP